MKKIIIFFYSFLCILEQLVLEPTSFNIPNALVAFAGYYVISRAQNKYKDMLLACYIYKSTGFNIKMMNTRENNIKPKMEPLICQSLYIQLIYGIS